jgi:hypothetical protein
LGVYPIFRHTHMLNHNGRIRPAKRCVSIWTFHWVSAAWVSGIFPQATNLGTSPVPCQLTCYPWPTLAPKKWPLGMINRWYYGELVVPTLQQDKWYKWERVKLGCLRIWRFIYVIEHGGTHEKSVGLWMCIPATDSQPTGCLHSRACLCLKIALTSVSIDDNMSCD